MTEAYTGSTPSLQNIKELPRQALEAAMASFGEPGFRAAQLHRWLYSQQAEAFGSMSSISSGLRRKLSEAYDIRSAEVVGTDCEAAGEAPSAQGATEKYLLRLPDGELVESVLIPSAERMTACVSSQAGCPLQCQFCATGHMGFKRNLHAFEITDQAYALQAAAEQAGSRLTNIVFMGMGEPLLNLDNVFEAISTLTSPDYRFSLSEKRITISTVGLVPGIERIASSGLKTKLAVSLHTADQQLRERMMPVAARQYPLDRLAGAISTYNSRTGQPVTLVCMLLDGVNDSPEEARRLGRFAKRFLCRINLIDYNPIVNFKFRSALSATRDAFVRHLLDAGLHVTVRKSQGAAINAACGQLATRTGPCGSKAQ
jgi:23S rRNA (adenine2503-C2)-methyltransferase